MRKYFLFDSEGAALILEGARSFLYEDNKKIEAEIENLNGIYIIDQEPMKAVAFFRSAVTLSPEDKIYSFNLGTALLVAGKAAEAEKILIELAKNHFSPSFLYPQLFMTIGLAAEVNRGLTDNTAEQFYKKALDFNPALVEARLLLAIRKLRRYGMKDAEIDFKIFLEIAPDVDANDTMVNYRLLSYPDIYGYSRSIMHQAGSINLGTAAQATSVYMAVDAVLSTIQNKYNEAERILEDALSRSPGNIDALKAMAYVRWKEGKFSELLDLLKDAYKDNQNSYAILLLIGRAYQKVGNYRQAEKFFKQAASVAPDFYKSWSLWGDILMHLGSEEDALKKYKTALEKNPFDLHAIQGSIQLGVNTILNDERFKELLPF